MSIEYVFNVSAMLRATQSRRRHPVTDAFFDKRRRWFLLCIDNQQVADQRRLDCLVRQITAIGSLNWEDLSVCEDKWTLTWQSMIAQKQL